MEFVILDLEWNSTQLSESGKSINEIIEFGALKVDEKLSVIGEFSRLVTQEIGTYINSRTRKLTHLTTKILKRDGEPFDTVLEDFKYFLGDAVLLTWSNSDIFALMDNNLYHYGTHVLDYIKSYIDVQSYCQKMLEYSNNQTGKQIGLSAAAQMLNISQEYLEHHRALDDSLLTYQCLKKLYDKEKLLSFIQDSSQPDFYNRLAYKPTYISEMDSPLLDKNELYIDCPNCGVRCIIQDEWQIKNRCFKAKFKCPVCNDVYSGRLQFKVLFDGVIVKRKALPIEEVTEDTGNDLDTKEEERSE